MKAVGGVGVGAVVGVDDHGAVGAGAGAGDHHGALGVCVGTGGVSLIRERNSFNGGNSHACI